MLQLGPGYWLMSLRDLRVLAYRGRGGRKSLRRIPLTDEDIEFMNDVKMELPNPYSKEDCRRLESFIQMWDEKYLDKTADMMTEKYPVQKKKRREGIWGPQQTPAGTATQDAPETDDKKAEKPAAAKNKDVQAHEEETSNAEDNRATKDVKKATAEQQKKLKEEVKKAAAEQKKAAAEERKKAAAEQKKAAAEQKRTAAEERRKAAAEQKKAAAEQKKAAAEERRKAAAEQKKAAAEQKKAAAEQKKRLKAEEKANKRKVSGKGKQD